MSSKRDLGLLDCADRVATAHSDDVRFTVPLYTTAEAGRYLDVRGIEHALASRTLYLAGAQLLWEVSGESALDDDARHGARDLIVLKDNQYVFRQVIEQYLRQITYEEEYARHILLPGYEVAQLAADPATNFGKPYFTKTGTPLYVVQNTLKAGENIEDVADDFDLPVDQVTEVAQRDGLLAS